VSAGSRLLRVASLATLGALTGRHVNDPMVGLAGAAAAVILGELAVWVLRGMLSLGNASVRADHGAAALRAAVDDGFRMLLPYAALALIADLGLGWQSAQAFSAAGLLTAGSLAGAALTAKGGASVYNALLPMAVLLPLVAAWAWLAASAAALVAP
jgi:hypothetical protein